MLSRKDSTQKYINIYIYIILRILRVVTTVNYEMTLIFSDDVLYANIKELMSPVRKVSMRKYISTTNKHRYRDKYNNNNNNIYLKNFIYFVLCYTFSSYDININTPFPLGKWLQWHVFYCCNLY